MRVQVRIEHCAQSRVDERRAHCAGPSLDSVVHGDLWLSKSQGGKPQGGRPQGGTSQGGNTLILGAQIVSTCVGRGLSRLVNNGLAAAIVRTRGVHLEPSLLEVAVSLLSARIHLLLVATHAVHGRQHALGTRDSRHWRWAARDGALVLMNGGCALHSRVLPARGYPFLRLLVVRIIAAILALGTSHAIVSLVGGSLVAVLGCLRAHVHVAKHVLLLLAVVVVDALSREAELVGRIAASAHSGCL